MSICTYAVYTHVEISVAALRAGKHVLCEPVAPTLAGLDAIEAQASRKVFSGVFQLRFGRGARQLRLLLDEGKFGRLHLGIAETCGFEMTTTTAAFPGAGHGTRKQEGPQ